MPICLDSGAYLKVAAIAAVVFFQVESREKSDINGSFASLLPGYLLSLRIVARECRYAT